MPRPDRKRQILEAFALMLQSNTGARITTAALAREIGVSEAALYRHFPSKAKMIEALLEFAEQSVFSRVSVVLREESNVQQRCYQILYLLLSFVEKNPGFARLLVGDALQGENDRLRLRVRQFFDRLETQLRQVVREYQATMHDRPQLSARDAANLLLSAAEGQINQFVRSEFEQLPTTAWPQHWSVLRGALLN